MNKILAFLSLTISIVIFSQSKSFSQSKGDLFVGADSELAVGRIQDLGLSPVIGYQVTNNLQFGVNFVVNTTNNTSYDWYQGYLKWYPTFVEKAINDNVRPFFKGSVGTSTTDKYTNVGVSIGATGFLAKWFYLEPSITYSYYNISGDINRLGVNVACGIRL